MKVMAIDASVVLKWYLDDEIHGDDALSLLNRFGANDIDFIAPTLLEYEVINGLTIAWKRGRIAEAALIKAISAFQSLGIEFTGMSGLGPKILFYVKKYARPVYDAAYLAVADASKADLITADKSLYNAVSQNLPWVRLLDPGEP